MKLKYTYLPYLAMVLLSFTNTAQNKESKSTLRVLTSKKSYTAGSAIVLKFSSESGLKPDLYLSNSYGATIIKPILKSDTLHYPVPESMNKKTGVASWKLLIDDVPLSGTFYIDPKPEVSELETYLGPPSIVVGNIDFSMLVVLPTDVHDNPLPDSTAVTVKSRFLEKQDNSVIYTKNRIGYKNIYSGLKTGRFFISTESLGIDSKEYDINVLPDIPTDFTITYRRHHEYADGNQITSFFTSEIKDKYGNTVSDGTYVQFFIKNGSGHILKTSGTTIKGVAVAKMIHPDHKENWQVKAFIEGMAKSNAMALKYKTVILDYDVHFSKNKRTITIGPLKSFMNQMIPDGLQASLSVYQNDKKLKTLYASSSEGYANFKLSPNDFPTNNYYELRIEIAGITKAYSNIKL